MDSLLFIYNIVLIIFLTIDLTGFCIIYMKSKTKDLLFLALLFLLLIVDNSIIYLSEFSISFESLYETSDIVYAFIYLVYFGIILTARFVIRELFNDKFTTREKQLCIIIPIILAVLCFWAPYEISEGLIYISFFTALSYIAFRAYRHINNNPDKFDMKSSRKFTILLMAIIALSILSIIESTLFYIDFSKDSSFDSILDYRNIFFDITKLLICVIGIMSLYNSFQRLFNEKSVEGNLDSFCIKHSLTSRQKEIIQLIIDGYSNKEISGKLHITEGTVKTHIYNIFQKTDISSRHQLLKKIIQD